MNTKSSTLNCYKAEIYWKGQLNRLSTMATSKSKAKQNFIAQLAKLLNLQITIVAGNFKRNPDHCKIQKEN